MIRAAGLFAAALVALSSSVAMANDHAIGTLVYASGAYRFTTQTKPGVHFSLGDLRRNLGIVQNTAFSVILPDRVSSTFLSDLEGEDCNHSDCFRAESVKRFFTIGRTVDLTYGEAGLDAVQIVPLAATLSSPSEHDALLQVIAREFPESYAAQTAPTADGKPLYVSYNSESGECEERFDPDRRAEIEQSIRFQNESTACRTRRAEDPQADQKAARARQLAIDKEEAEEQRKSREEQKAEKIASERKKREEERRVKSSKDAAVRNLPQSRRIAYRAYQKCFDSVDLRSCAAAELTARDNYKLDKEKGRNGDLCVDRQIIASSQLYEAQLTSGYLTMMQMVQVDGMLGEIIDNCPQQAGRALIARKRLHNL